MPDFVLQPHFSTWRMQRLADRVRPRVGTYYVPILEAEEEDPMLFTIPIRGRDHPAPQKPQRLESYPRLLSLPPELLVKIMLILPHSSLYMVRRTCSVLRNITDDFRFKAFQTDILRQGGEHSCLTKAGFNELRMIKRILLRSTLCGPCGRLFDSDNIIRPSYFLKDDKVVGKTGVHALGYWASFPFANISRSRVRWGRAPET
ncbi:uncharacterized protein FSUBG_7942 [Fusarium subglutinans]|uniref:F-box domain-containing protein n=1 Tax=Gibberella subglutinans TaxID=42677 RepID=A0A8H5PRB0_GIBSU|nr:uncharacterized protein FSUBG_7942 [Fusarium subglutinans]KAF5601960.1 hypothetical protein FSUBG_7942 [Fusarium subglutinans]